MLVGGTALAGYYLGHRRSDDLDLFVRDADAHRATVLAIQSLRELGARIETSFRSSQFQKSICALDGHAFTADVVLDPTVHALGDGQVAGDGVRVAALETLMGQKAATLVSRCAEKDLYDLLWLFRLHPDLELASLLELGSRIDGGLTAESALISLVGTELMESACAFSITQSAEDVFREIMVLKSGLEQGLAELARNQPVPPLGELIKKLGRPRTPRTDS